MKRNYLSLFLIPVVLFVMACKPCSSEKDRDTLYQVNLLQSLMQGYYDGTATIKDLKENGDTGIGTFDGVNGELIALDGVVYQVLSDGTVAVPDDSTGIPYSAMSYFDSDISAEFNDVKSFDDLTSRLYEIIKNDSVNSFYLIKITGNFKTMYARSELKQEKPYKPLAEALKTDQREFHYENIPGTIVALYCPSYMGELNSVGFHLHFISDDKTKGGHVFAFTSDKLNVELDKTTKFNMVLSANNEFDSLDLSKDMTNDMNAVEKG